jgi:hypothetical protein
MAESNWTRREFLEASSIAACGLVAIGPRTLTARLSSGRSCDWVSGCNRYRLRGVSQ